MAFVDDLRALCHGVRAIPGGFGLRPHTVELIARTFSTADAGLGTATEVVTPIAHAGGVPPKVRWLKAEDIAVGGLDAGSVEIGPITPELGAEIATLHAAELAAGALRLIRITGPMHPDGAVYKITSIVAHRGFQYKIQAAPAGAE